MPEDLILLADQGCANMELDIQQRWALHVLKYKTHIKFPSYPAVPLFINNLAWE